MTKMILLPMMLFNLVEGGAQHANLRLRAEENEVPKSVVGSFREEYVNASGAAWAIISSSSLEADFGIYEKDEREKSTYYDVSFTESDGHKEVVYDHFGHSVGVKKSVTTASLPAPVAKTVRRTSEHVEIISAAEVFERGSVPSHYLIVISDRGTAQSIIVLSSGELVKTN